VPGKNYAPRIAFGVPVGFTTAKTRESVLTDSLLTPRFATPAGTKTRNRRRHLRAVLTAGGGASLLRRGRARGGVAAHRLQVELFLQEIVDGLRVGLAAR
jgi:hypothetical protein